MSDKHETMITNALRVAAERYDEDAAQCRRAIATLTNAAAGDLPAVAVGHQRLAEQFERQAIDARDLADKIDEQGLELVAYL